MLQQYYNLNIDTAKIVLDIREIIGDDGKKAYSYDYKNPKHHDHLSLITYLDKYYVPLSQIPNYLTTLSQLKAKKLFWKIF